LPGHRDWNSYWDPQTEELDTCKELDQGKKNSTMMLRIRTARRNCQGGEEKGPEYHISLLVVLVFSWIYYSTLPGHRDWNCYWDPQTEELNT
tara:strand:- start:161 stop:436 length:276 start_codon:yes stop_codon:yes gene_type:complete